MELPINSARALVITLIYLFFFPPSNFYIYIFWGETQNTNVVQLFSHLEKDKHQLAYYNSGIGTYVKDEKSWLSWSAWKQSAYHSVDMAIAR
jgi:hypothetical protein